MGEYDWRPSASWDLLRQRAQLLTVIRDFFQQRGYLEVETPLLARYGITDVYLRNINASFRGENYCLQTSPEYHMKRLLAAGSGPIFQLARVFRDDELGRWHNPEFTMLEWYQLHVDHHALMREVDDLLGLVLGCSALCKKSYKQVFLENCQLDPFTATCEEMNRLLAHCQLQNVLPESERDRDQYLYLLMSHVVEPALALLPTPVAVYDFPPSQASLAQVNQGVAERFEIYYRGVELANGFHELQDKTLQAARFQQDRLLRAQRGLPDAEVDGYLLQALDHGLPACSGVAFGVDRLIALALNQPAISNVMAFDFSRA